MSLVNEEEGQGSFQIEKEEAKGKEKERKKEEERQSILALSATRPQNCVGHPSVSSVPRERDRCVRTERETAREP